MPRHAKPALMAIECGTAVSSRRMLNQSLFVRFLIEDFEADGFSADSCAAPRFPAADFRDRSRSAKSLYVVVNRLVGRRRVDGKLFRFKRRAALRFRMTFTLNQRNCFRFQGTSVAGVTGHLPVSLETILVDREHHSHHVARNPFGFLVVPVKLVLHMAIAAFHAE